MPSGLTGSRGGLQPDFAVKRTEVILVAETKFEALHNRGNDQFAL